MTDLKSPVTRRSDTVVRDGTKRRRLVITIYPNDCIGLRPERTQREELLSIDSAYSLAVKQRVAKERAEKKRGRKN